MATIDRDGVPIYYETHGEHGEPVLLIMGLGADAHAWEFQVPDFSARHRVVLVDNRGVGRSGKPAGQYTTSQMADDALAVLDALGIRRAHVVGISMGGMIAQELALSHPERVGGLVLAATYARPGEEARQTAGEGAQKIGGVPSPLELLKSGAIDLSQIDVRQIFQFLMPMVLSQAFLVEKREWLQAFFERSMGYGFSVPAFLGQVAAVMSHDTVARLPSLRIPTLVITGLGDRLVPPRHSEELARLIPGARLVTIEDATHGFNFEVPAHFNKAILDFLAEHPLSAS